jgi:hypothetical protein
MDYNSLKTAITSFTHRDDVTDIADTLISMAESRMNQVLRLDQMCLVATTTIASEFTALPDDFLEMRNIRVNSDTPYAVEYRSPHKMVHLMSADVNEKPKYYTVQSDSIQMVPRGLGSEIEINYIARISGLTSTNTTNFLIEQTPDIYLHGCLYYASIYAKNQAGVQFHGAEFERMLSDLNMQETNRKYSGVPLEIVID